MADKLWLSFSQQTGDVTQLLGAEREKTEVTVSFVFGDWADMQRTFP